MEKRKVLSNIAQFCGMTLLTYIFLSCQVDFFRAYFWNFFNPQVLAISTFGVGYAVITFVAVPIIYAVFVAVLAARKALFVFCSQNVLWVQVVMVLMFILYHPRLLGDVGRFVISGLLFATTNIVDFQHARMCGICEHTEIFYAWYLAKLGGIVSLLVTTWASPGQNPVLDVPWFHTGCSTLALFALAAFLFGKYSREKREKALHEHPASDIELAEGGQTQPGSDSKEKEAGYLEAIFSGIIIAPIPWITFLMFGSCFSIIKWSDMDMNGGGVAIGVAIPLVFLLGTSFLTYDGQISFMSIAAVDYGLWGLFALGVILYIHAPSGGSFLGGLFVTFCLPWLWGNFAYRVQAISGSGKSGIMLLSSGIFMMFFLILTTIDGSRGKSGLPLGTELYEIPAFTFWILLLTFSVFHVIQLVRERSASDQEEDSQEDCGIRAYDRKNFIFPKNKKPLVIWVVLILFLPAFIYLGASANRSIYTPDDTTFKVMTFNVMEGMDLESHQNYFDVTRIISEEKPHIIGLQETNNIGVLFGSRDISSYLAHKFGFDVLNTYRRDEKSDLTILSTLPFASSPPPERMLLPVAENCIECPHRSLSTVVVEFQGTEIIFMTTHLQFGVDEALLAQTQFIADYINDIDSDKNIILAGDFNFNPGEEWFSILNSTRLLQVMEFNSLTPFTDVVEDVVIDYIMYSGNGIELVENSGKVLDNLGTSDHTPVVAEFVIL